MIEDFDRAVNVEALQQIKEIGEHLILMMVPFSIASCRAGAFAWAAGIYVADLSLGYSVYGWHSWIPPQTTHSWATKEPGRGRRAIYGLPGIGKTWLAHSIYAKI